MFVPNPNQQISIFDSVYNMPEYLREILFNSWAHPFQKYIFPAIYEERFAILYSDKGSRPNTPVNVIIGALLLKEVFDLTDEQLLGSIFFDDRFQYALRLTSEERPPVSYNTFYNFRKKVEKHLKEEGVDLIQQEIEDLADVIAKHLKIDGKKVRVDSFMVSSSCKNMSRIELIYTVNYQYIKMLKDIDIDFIPDECTTYLEKGHKNDTIYRTKNSKIETKIEFLLKHSKKLYDVGLEVGKQITQTEEFKLLKRMLGEQTKDDDNFDNIEPKENKDLSSDSLQNPNDPDATYRFKYSGNVGYVANIAEIFDDNNSLIKFYDLKPNIYSDQNFCEDSLQKITEDDHFESEPIKDKTISGWNHLSKLINMFVDGTYFSFELAQKALNLGIGLIPGELTGKKPSPDKINYSEFEVAKNKEIVKCPENKSPEFSIYHKDTEIYSARFSKNICESCSRKETCRVQEIKDSYSIRFSRKQYEISKLRANMKITDYKKLTNQRAGVEGIPSVFRRQYNVDKMPIRGKVRSKIWFGFKVGAANVKKLFKRLQVQGV